MESEKKVTISQYDLEKIKNKVRKQLGINDLTEMYIAPIYIARELNELGMDFPEISNIFHNEYTIKELKNGIKKLPKKENEGYKRRRDYNFETNLFLSRMHSMSDEEKKGYFSFIKECLMWGEKR